MITMYPAKVNSPATILASGINAAVTIIPLVHSSVLPAAPNLAAIGTDEDTETILYLTINGNNLENVTRGFQGVAKPWASGTQVARFLTAYDLDTLKANLEAHDPATTGVHGIGAGTIAKVGDIAVNANLSPAAQDAIAKKHAQGTDVALGAVGTKDPPIDADKALYRDSVTADALVTSTWTQIKAFLKTYFDTLYSNLAHKLRHQSGGADEISVAGLAGLLADDQHVLDAEVVTAAKTIKLDDFTAPDDNIDLDANAAKHGLMPKADKSKLDGIEALMDIYSRDWGLNWADLGVIASGNIYTMAYLGNGIAILGDASGHIFRSTDYGATWIDLGDVASVPIWAIIYLGNDIVILGDDDKHVWRSTDYGLTWTDLGVIASGSIFAMAYLGNGIAILGDAAFHVWRSTDYGLTWADLGVITSDYIRTMAYLSNGIAVLADEDYHVWRSTDYGLNWADLGIITTDTPHVMSYLGNGIVILGDSILRIHRSTDYGLTWTDLGVIASDQIRAMAYLGNGIAILGDGLKHVWRSTDYGLTWTDLGVIASGIIYAAVYLGNGITLLADRDNHVFRSTSAFQVWNDGMTPHASEHENGGSDEIDVGGLSGELADLQKVKNHTHQAAGGGVGGKLDHGLALNGLLDDDHTQYTKHSLATAVSDFLVASGAGVFIKKTLAEVRTLLNWAADIATHAAALPSSTIHPNTSLASVSISGAITDTPTGNSFKLPFDTENYDLGSNFSVAQWYSSACDAGSGANVIIDADVTFTEAVRWSKVTWHDGFGFATEVTDAHTLAIVTVNGNAIDPTDVYTINHAEYTIPTTGYYRASTYLGYANLVVDHRYAAVLRYYRGGTWYLIGQAFQHSSVAATLYVCSSFPDAYLIAGDLLIVTGYQDSGVTTVDVNIATLSIAMIQGA